MAKSGIKFLYLSGGPESITSINCLSSSPYLSGTVVLTPFTNLTSFQGGDNGLEAVVGFSQLTALKSFQVDGSNTISFDISSLPSNLEVINIQGNNTITGNFDLLSAICPDLYYYEVRGRNTVTGNLSAFSPKLEFFATGSTSIGNVIAGNLSAIPFNTNLKNLGIGGSGRHTITGDIANLKDKLPNVTNVLIRGLNTITGNISSVSPSLTDRLTITGNNTITGNIANLSGVRYIELEGNNTISGSLSTLPPQVDWVSIKGPFNKVNNYYDGTEGRGYNKKTWRTPMRNIEVAPGLSASRPFPQEHLVTLLTDLTSVSAWEEGITAQSNCEAIFTSLYPEVTAAIQRNQANGCTVTINGPISAAPSFYRDFARYKTLNHGGALSGAPITFTRNSSATYFDSNGVMQVATSGVPRFDHDPATGASRGLLIEEARTNLLERSAEFDDNYWTKSRASITPNSITAPDGTLTADKLVENTEFNRHFITTSSAGSTNQTYTLSIYAKAGERNVITLFLQGEGGNAIASFDLTLNNAPTAALGAGASNPPPYTNISSSISSVGSGWYRCSLTATTGLGNSTNNPRIELGDFGGRYPGDGASGLYIWGAQLEQGIFPTSYIPTTTLSATRSQDFAVVTPINSFFNSNEGTMVAKAFAPISGSGTIEQPSPGAHRRIVNVGNGVTINGDHFSIGRGGNDDTRATIAGPGIPDGLIYIDKTFIKELDYQRKVSYSYKLNSPYIVGAGGTVTTGAVLTALPVVNTMTIGSDLSSWSGTIVAVTDRYLNGHVSSIMYFPTYFTTTQIQQISI